MADDDGNAAAAFDSLRARNRQITAVHAAARLLSSTIDLDDRLRDILAVSMEAVSAAAGSIFLYREATDKLVFQYVAGSQAAELLGKEIDAHEGLAGAVFQSGQPRIDNQPRESANFLSEFDHRSGFVTESIVTVPLQYQAGHPVGVMQVLNKRTGGFDGQDLEVLEIVSSVAAAAIENAKLAREAQLAAVSHAIGDLSHDIKNKITPIAVGIDTLRPVIGEMVADLDSLCAGNGELRKRVHYALEPFRALSEEIFAMIGDQVQVIQDYTRLIADAMKGIVSEPQLVPHELEVVIARQLDMLEPVAARVGVCIVRLLDSSTIFAFDRFLVERAVANLVSNAIPETAAGGKVTVRVSSRADGTFPEGGYVLIEVADTGRGMPANALARILSGDAKSTKPGGTGLGTRIVFNAITAHHGRFEGDSIEGRGSCFRLRLPFRRG